MSRMTTSLASFSWRARRCGVPVRVESVGSGVLVGARVPVYSGVAVEAVPRDARRATAGGTSPSIGSPRATRSRISREETATGSSSKKTTRRGASSRARASSSARVARAVSPRRGGRARAPAPAPSSSGSRRTRRRRSGRPRPRAGALSSKSTVRACRRARPRRPGTSANASRASSSRVSAGVRRRLWPGSATTSTRSASSRKLLDRGARERDVPVVRRVERAAEEAERHGHCTRAPRRRSRPRRPCARRPRGAPPRARPRAAACRRRGSPGRCGGSGTRAARSARGR